MTGGTLQYRFEPKSLRRIQRGMRRAPRETRVVVRELFRVWNSDWDRRMQTRFRAPLYFGPGPNPNTTLHSRTGRGRRSIKTTVRGSVSGRGKIVGRAFTESRVLAVQETGAVITPKRAKALTIPLRPALTPAGVPRFPSARQVPDLVYKPPGKRRKSDDGTIGVLGKRSGAKGKGRFRAWYLLRRRVTIPGPTTTGTPSRLGFFDTWAKLRRRRRRQLGDAGSAILRVMAGDRRRGGGSFGS